MAKLAMAGHDVFIAILGEGATSRFSKREEADVALVGQLRTNSHEAADVVGAREVFLYGLPDNRFDSVNLLDVVKIVEELVRRLSPQAVYTHHPGDLNIDHGIVSRAVLTATRPTKGSPVREVYAFEVASSTEWAFQQVAPPFRPNTFVDISSTLEAKIQALMKYPTEVQPFPHPRSREALTSIAHRWGGVAGCDAAEAFELIRAIRV